MEMQYKNARFVYSAENYSNAIIREWPRYEKRISIAKADRWLDVGGCIGSFTCQLAPSVAHIVAVEPAPENFSYLSKNVRLNRLKNVTLINGAVVPPTADTGKMRLYLNGGTNNGNHSILPIRGRQSIVVRTYEINALLAEHRINSLKLDCEGAELALLQGMSLSSFRRLQQIVLEYHFNMLHDRDHSKFASMVKFLRKTFRKVTTSNITDKCWLAYVLATNR